MNIDTIIPTLLCAAIVVILVWLVILLAVFVGILMKGSEP